MVFHQVAPPAWVWVRPHTAILVESLVEDRTNGSRAKAELGAEAKWIASDGDAEPADLAQGTRVVAIQADESGQVKGGAEAGDGGWRLLTQGSGTIFLLPALKGSGDDGGGLLILVIVEGFVPGCPSQGVYRTQVTSTVRVAESTE